MDIKDPNNPPDYNAVNSQGHPGYEQAPPYPGPPAGQPPTWGPSPQQPGYMGQQGYAANNVVYTQAPPTNNVVVTSVADNMGLAIFATFCCFWPLGLVAILRSSEVRSALAVNDFPTAQRLAEESRRMSRLSILIGAIMFVSIFIIVLVINVTTI